LLPASDVSQTQIISLLPLFEDLVFRLGDDMTPVHLAIAEQLPLFLFHHKALAFSLRLLVDDIPKVRTLAVKAVSGSLRMEFRHEILVFREAAALLGRTHPELLAKAALSWIGVMEAKAKRDVYGELLTTFVDEFFLVREVFAVLHWEWGFSSYPLDSFVNIRKQVITNVLDVIGHA
jgi:hypothetical protein